MNPIEALRNAILRDVRHYHQDRNRTNLRPYEPGDDYRHIDWNATARQNELHTRVSHAGKSLTLASIIDTSASMRAGRARSLSHAAEEACQTWRRIATSDDRYIDLSNDNVASALELAYAKLPKGTALLVISDCFELLPGHPIAAKCNCTLLFARDPWHEQLPLRGFHCIRDTETNLSRSIFIGARERERYYTAVRKREETIVTQFLSAGWRTGTLTETNGTEAIFKAFDVIPNPSTTLRINYASTTHS